MFLFQVIYSNFASAGSNKIIVRTLKQYGARMQSNSSVLVKRTDLVIAGYGSYYLQNLQIFIFKRITKILSRLKFNNLAYYLLKKVNQVAPSHHALSYKRIQSLYFLAVITSTDITEARENLLLHNISEK
ncbi:Hypothetical_protein [Hexamita inflata]|uniref:Hypothetical_protein n=1 Tax=Hexamita inflata TaxID=28002 RepID=A0AA86TH08_9EUKA|nr:Hypothetical protein HINF_LOCUS3527 [Hexamita inflata]